MNGLIKRGYSITFLIYLLFALVNFLFPFPDLIKSFLSLPSILIFPLNTGYFLIKIIENLIHKKINVEKTESYVLITSWCLGSIFITLISIRAILLLDSLGSQILLTLIISLSLLSLYDGKLDQIFLGQLTSRKNYFLLVAGLMGLLPFVYIRSLSSFPYMIGFDFFDYSRIISAIIEGRILPTILSTFYVLISISVIFFNVHPLHFFWSVPLIPYVLLPIGIYLFAQKLLNSNWWALLSALVATWAQGSGMTNDMYYLSPKIFLYVLFPFSLYLLMVNNNKLRFKKKLSFLFFILPILLYICASPGAYSSVIIKWPTPVKLLLSPIYALTEPAVFIGSPIIAVQQLYALFLVIMIFILLISRLKIIGDQIYLWFILSITTMMIHPEMGVVFSIILLSYVFIRSFAEEHLKFSIVIVLSLFSICFMYFLFRWSGIDNIISKAFLDNLELIPNLITVYERRPYTFDFNWMIKYLESTYTRPIILFSFIGLGMSIKDIQNINKSHIASFFTFTIVIFLYLLPFPYALRILIFATPFISYYTAYLLWSFYKSINKVMSTIELNLIKRESSSRRLKVHLSKVLFIVLLILFLPSLTSSYDNSIKYWNTLYNYNGNLTTFIDLDIEVAAWIEDNLPYETIIVTDPLTLQILGGLTGLQYSFDGRTFISNTSKATTPIPLGRNELFKSIINSYSYQEIEELETLYVKSDMLKGDKIPSNREIILVVNGRTEAWVLNKEYTSPSTIENFLFIETLIASRTLDLIYDKNGQYFIFKHKEHSLESGLGPSILVSEVGSTKQETISTQYSYYEFFDLNITLTLTGLTSYNVSGYPSYYSFEKILLNGLQTKPKKGWDANKYILIENTSPIDNITVIWKANLYLKNIGWWDDSFLEGWSQGSISRKEMDGYGFNSDGDIASLYLGAGKMGDYTSISNFDLNINSSQYPMFSIRIKGTDNSQVIIRLILKNGEEINLFGYWFKPLDEWIGLRKNIQSQTHGEIVKDIIIFYKTVDGNPASVLVDYSLFSTKISKDEIINNIFN